MKYSEVNDVLSSAKTVIVLQADNPDGDSLGSSLALEAILSEMSKTVVMVCAIDMPAHLKYLSGWDRVVKDVPQSFDATIIVDSSTETLFENANSTLGYEWIKTKPVIVLDHHIDSPGISFAEVSINEPVVATGELIYKIAKDLNWPLPLDACEMLATSIMSDSLGLTTTATTSDSIRTIADLVDLGVDMAKLDAARRELMKKEPELIPYKGELLKRVEFVLDGKIATITIPWKEIEQYSPLYNPTMLVIDDMRMTVGVRVAIGYKVYSDGKITAKIRCNYGSPVAHIVAEKFGGGGHPYAAGFKIRNGKTLGDIKKEVISVVDKALKEDTEL